MSTPNPTRTPNGKVYVFDPESGERLERWPVDARELVDHHGFSYGPPSEDAAVSSSEGSKSESGPIPPGADRLLETSTRDLRAAVEATSDMGVLKAALGADERTTAAPIYQARIDQLEGRHALGNDVPLNAATGGTPVSTEGAEG